MHRGIPCGNDPIQEIPTFQDEVDTGPGSQFSPLISFSSGYFLFRKRDSIKCIFKKLKKPYPLQQCTTREGIGVLLPRFVGDFDVRMIKIPAHFVPVHGNQDRIGKWKNQREETFGVKTRTNNKLNLPHI